MEVIPEAVSNSLVVFIFCNLIILILLLISSSTSEAEIPTPIRMVTDKKMNDYNEKIIIVEPSFQESQCLITSNAHIALKGTVYESAINVGSEQIALPNSKIALTNARTEVLVYESTIHVGSGQTAVTNAINTNKDYGDEDELRRKVEEFIERVNKGWKEEKLRAHTFVHTQPELTKNLCKLISI